MRAAPGIIFGKKASLSVRKQQTRIYRFLRRTSGRYSDMYLGSDTQLNFPLASCRTIILALQYIRTQEVGETRGNTGKYGEIRGNTGKYGEIRGNQLFPFPSSWSFFRENTGKYGEIANTDCGFVLMASVIVPRKCNIFCTVTTDGTLIIVKEIRSHGLSTCGHLIK